MNNPKFNLFDEVKHKSIGTTPFMVIGVLYVWQEQRFRYFCRAFDDHSSWEMNLEDDLELIRKGPNESNCV